MWLMGVAVGTLLRGGVGGGNRECDQGSERQDVSDYIGL